MKNFGFDSLKKQRSTDKIENYISSMIIKGIIRPGEKLPTEKELSEKFDVSVGTIREALRGLEVSGLIEKIRGKGGGIFATEITNDSLRMSLRTFLVREECSPRDLAQVRLMIEPAIIKTVAPQINSSELGSLEDNLAYCEARLKKDVITPKECQEVGEKNIEFHRLIAQAMHNPIFVLTLDYVNDFVYNFRKNTLDIGLFGKVVNEHRNIFNSLKEHNAIEAEAKMLAHLKNLEEHDINERPLS